MKVIEDGKALFLQIAESVEESILDGTLAEETQAPSTNELAAFYRINPATAGKGINMLVEKGVLEKRRGVGMFVTPGAQSMLRAEREESLAQRLIDPLLAEAARLGLDAEAITQRVAERARTHATENKGERA